MSHRWILNHSYFFLSLFLISLTAAALGFEVDNDAGLKKLLLSQLTPEEHNMFFGDLKTDPSFYLIRPSLLPYHLSGDLEAKKLKISYAETSIEVVVYPSEELLASHIRKGGFMVGGVPIDYASDSCHFRFSNKTLIVAVNDCHPGFLDGMILTAKHVGIFHPVPQRLIHLLYDKSYQSSSSPEQNLWDYHIFHLAEKSLRPVPLRKGRSIRRKSESLKDEANCATDDKHDMTGRPSSSEVKSMRPPSLRGFNELVPDLQEDLNKITNDSHQNDIIDPLTIVKRKTLELAVFCDDVLYNNFPQKLKNANSTRLLDYILTLINAIQGIYHQEELQGYVLDLLIVKLDIQTSAIQGPSKSGGDIGAYLSSFCDWQKQRNPEGEEAPEHWDHAIMLSGLDLHSSGNPSVIGLAWVSGMCRPSISCTMNEGRSFMAVYVVAHELGHNLGMNHDGQGSASGCNSGKYIMSPSVGPGKTTWSQCSIEVLHSFLRKSSCLDDGVEGRTYLGRYSSAPETRRILHKGYLGRGNPMAEHLANDISYHQLNSLWKWKMIGAYPFWMSSCEEIVASLNIVCIENPLIFLLMCISIPDKAIRLKNQCYLAVVGAGTYAPLPPLLVALRDKTPGHQFSLTEQCQAMHGRDYFPALTKFDLCDYLYCTNGVLTKPAHPALEGSPCGPHRICLGGECRPEEELSRFLQLYGEVASDHSPINGSKTESPSYDDDLPVIAVSEGNEDTCTCAGLPQITKKPPKDICPLLARMFQPLFDCQEQCSQEDLFIKFENDKFDQIVTGKQKENESGICSFFVNQVLASVNIHKNLLPNFRNTQISMEEHQILCSVMPGFITSVLPCPQTINVNRCLLNTSYWKFLVITLLMFNKTLTRTEEISNGEVKYSLLNSSEDLDFASSSLRDLPSRDFLSFSKCNQDQISSDFQVTLEEICPYLPSSFRAFFNCTLSYQVCENSVIFLDAENNVGTKVPVRSITESREFLKCNRCASVYEDLNKILTNLKKSNDEVLEKVCHLIPSAWTGSISTCGANNFSYFIKDNCLPSTLVVQGTGYDFTYSPHDSNDGHLIQSSVEWKGHPFFLKKISYAGKLKEKDLETKYDVDFSKKYVFRFHQSELITRPRDAKFKNSSQEVLPLSLRTSNVPLPLKVRKNLSVNESLHRMENLQEYIGQRDAYLASNSALVMPRTYVGPCSVTCGQGIRPINVECVDVTTEEVVDDGSCQGFIDTEIDMEPCFMPPCSAARWSIGEWGPCSESCGSGVQYREVICAMRLEKDQSQVAQQLRGNIELVVDGSLCSEKQPAKVRECKGQCKLPVWCEEEDCLDYQNIQISKDFDY
ncbi:LOW QUALITY PROTEIN: uncharacterized protein [Macrobrachium rosenbergii]|uniref:LOW QUALITY PROTEIN: uncharacterized protein n=1 Tax=Macrobrachium rosenbergii TaxID=79674 RepID=UPI0034D67133